MIIKDTQMSNVGTHPLYGKLEGIKARTLNPDEFATEENSSEKSLFHEISWVEMPPNAVIPKHRHEGCEEAKIIIYGIGIYTENGVQEKVDAGDVILTQEGLEHSLENVGYYPLVYVAVTVTNCR